MTRANDTTSTSTATNDDEILHIGRRLVTDVLEPLKRTFVGKDEIVDLMGVCLVAGENLFLLGPPGTAKSALVQGLGRRLAGRTFEYLLTRFTEPSEIFGPFDIRKLRDGELLTNTQGMLPEASFVFLDELLNANSAILNALLGVLNERVFRRGQETRRLPMLMAVGASNRLPEDDALGALFDRFLMRVRCDNVADDHLGEVLSAGWQLERSRHDAVTQVDIESVRALNAALPSVDLAAVRGPIVDLVRRLRTVGMAISDRRAVKLQRLIAASALLAGRRAAIVSDLWVFRYIWDTVEQQEMLAAVVQETLASVEQSSADHPRARGDDAPDPEAIAHELNALANEPKDGPATADKLSLLAARCQWVRDPMKRDALLRRVDEQWPMRPTPNPA